MAPLAEEAAVEAECTEGAAGDGASGEGAAGEGAGRLWFANVHLGCHYTGAEQLSQVVLQVALNAQIERVFGSGSSSDWEWRQQQ